MTQTELEQLQAIADEHGPDFEVEVTGKGLAGLTYSVLRRGKRKVYSVTPARIVDYFEGRRAAGVE